MNFPENQLKEYSTIGKDWLVNGGCKVITITTYRGKTQGGIWGVRSPLTLEINMILQGKLIQFCRAA